MLCSPQTYIVIQQQPTTESDCKFCQATALKHIAHTHPHTQSMVTRKERRKTVHFMGIAFSFIYVYIAFLKEENKEKVTMAALVWIDMAQ